MLPYLEQIGVAGFTFYLVGLALVVVMIKWHTDDDPRFDFRLALLDPKTDRISFSRLGTFVSLVISTTILCYMTVRDTVNEGIYIGYLGAWAGTFVASKLIERQYNTDRYTPPEEISERPSGSQKAYE